MFCNTIRATDHWQLVSSLTVSGTYMTKERNRDDPSIRRYINPLENFDFGCLSSILSNLPPNLSKLVLDFPTERLGESNKSDDHLSIFDVIETSEQTLKLERTLNWWKLIFVVFDALSENTITSRQDFELCLPRISPLPCSVCGSVKFQRDLLGRSLGSMIKAARARNAFAN
jgi:hypothetical protein